MKEKLSADEKHLFNAILSARFVQEFLWGKHNAQWNLEEWKRMFRKRIAKIDDIDPGNPHASIELKKRLLQNAALCIALLSLLDNPDHAKILSNEYKVPSNLPQYKIRKNTKKLK